MVMISEISSSSKRAIGYIAENESLQMLNDPLLYRCNTHFAVATYLQIVPACSI